MGSNGLSLGGPNLDFSQASGQLIKIWENERKPEDIMEKYGKLGEVIEEYGNNMENTSEKKWETMVLNQE